MVTLALAVVIVMPASPASADSVTVTEPAGNAVLSSATVVVGGRAAVPPPTLGIPLSTLESVTVRVGDTTLPDDRCSGRTSCDYQVTFKLPLNGPYTAEVVGKPNGLLAGEASKASRSFAVAAPAARPVLAAPKVTDARNVELSWSRNTEPDMLYYAVFRKDPGASKSFQVGGKVAHPPSGSRVTFVDTTTSGVPGGEYSYQVVAVRKGASGSADTEKLSEPSAAGAATLPVTVTTSSTTVPAPGTPPAGPTTTVKPGAAAGIDLSGFLSSRSQPVTLPAITVPEPPDTGFAGSLPFGARPPGEELEEGEAEAVPPRRSPGSSVISVDAGRPLVPVAGGLVLLLLALHMRLLGRRVREPAGSDAALDLTPHTPAPAAVPAAVAPAEPDPDRSLYDIEAEDMADADVDREDDWAPRRPMPVPPSVRKREPRPVRVASPKPDPETISEMTAAAVPVAAVEPEPVRSATRKVVPVRSATRKAAPDLESVAEISPEPRPVRAAAPEPGEPDLGPLAQPQPAPVPVAPEPPEPVAVAVAAAEPVPEPVAETELEPEPVPVALVEVEWEPEPAAVEPEVVELWAPAEPQTELEPVPFAEAEREPEPVPVEPEVVELWAPAEPQTELEREPVPFAEVEREPEPVPVEPEVVELWAPPEPEDLPEPEPDLPVIVPDEIEIVEIVSSTRRRLVRTGGR